MRTTTTGVQARRDQGVPFDLERTLKALLLPTAVGIRAQGVETRVPHAFGDLPAFGGNTPRESALPEYTGLAGLRGRPTLKHLA